MSDTLLTSSNKVLAIPHDSVQAIGQAVIVRDTELFCLGETTESGIIIPDKAGDRKYGIGEVVATGPLVKEVGVGDVLVFLLASSSGMDPIPNGLSKAVLFKTVENSMSIICRIPAEAVQAEKERLNGHTSINACGNGGEGDNGASA